MSTQEPRSELSQAIADGDLEFVKMAIATGDDPNCPEEAPLFEATTERQREIAQFLLEAGADPNFPHLPNWSCLTQAVASNDLEWVEFLSQYGARVNVDFPDHDESELHKAAGRGLLEMTKLLMDKCGGRAALETFDYLDRTPLIAAAQSGHLEVVKYLLDAGADINALTQMNRDDKIGDTAIARAVREGHLEVVKLLLDRGADPYRPGWMWNNAFDRIRDTDNSRAEEMETILTIPELKRPAQSPHREEVERQLLEDLRFHGVTGTCTLDWKATKPFGETFTVRGLPLRPFSNLRVSDESGKQIAEGDVDFLVLTREIDFLAFWSKLTIDGKPCDLAPGVPPHILAKLNTDQKSWVVMDRRNYCGRLTREDLDRVR